jgi:transcriptional regulator with XRE-family HTH domain
MIDKNKKQKTNFGTLLEHYRNDRRVSQLALERRLSSSDYPITNSLISKYEYGERNPSPEFIHAVAIGLDLDKEQADALVEAHLADYTLKFWKAFHDASK